MKKLVFLSTILAVMASAGLLWQCGGSGSSSSKISEGLADQLTDSLAFSGGESKDGEPPAGHPGDSAYPQVATFTLPDLNTVFLGQEFTIALNLDQATSTGVAGAVIAIEGADSYIQVNTHTAAKGESGYDPSTGLMTLSGMLNNAQALVMALAGLYAPIRIAIIDESGMAGNYIQWKMEFPRGEGSGNPVENCRVYCERSGDCCAESMAMGGQSTDEQIQEECYSHVPECLASCEEDISQYLSANELGLFECYAQRGSCTAIYQCVSDVYQDQY